MPTVLVVEDDFLVRESISMLLEMEGFRIESAENGRHALDLLYAQQELPCLILLDLMMPVMDGVEFRSRQLGDPKIASVPVVVVSGKARLDELASLQALAILQKPFQLETVLDIIDRHCPRPLC
jgi:CheY-like chemotaxis protein